MAYVIGEDCIACGTCIDECPVGAISEGERYSSVIQLTQTCAPSVALALVFVLLRQSLCLSNRDAVLLTNKKEPPFGVALFVYGFPSRVCALPF